MVVVAMVVGGGGGRTHVIVRVCAEFLLHACNPLFAANVCWGNILKQMLGGGLVSGRCTILRQVLGHPARHPHRAARAPAALRVRARRVRCLRFCRRNDFGTLGCGGGIKAASRPVVAHGPVHLYRQYALKLLQNCRRRRAFLQPCQLAHWDRRAGEFAGRGGKRLDRARRAHRAGRPAQESCACRFLKAERLVAQKARLTYTNISWRAPFALRRQKQLL